ncbi:hypothetical protein F511_28344 [Dorcoceras hygrometricum]|uniref:Uncharacterized protein n=1 Tax=Dorcoceras hygrometricum TaxID=472368 RepID=A0A2Z7B3P0_9LAMI|nr:hypothetical protein F511_28344 [Dorcoceras hygrometricum]
MYYELMDPCVHGMVKWQHRGVTYRDPEIEHAEPLGSLGLNGAGDDPAEYIPTGGFPRSSAGQEGVSASDGP